MITIQQFENEVYEVLNRSIGTNDNPEQHDVICSPSNQSLFIVAGPGSGKTTVIVLRVLKLILVDNVSPTNIIATTFTRKASAELRSRILGWGDKLRRALMGKEDYSTIRDALENLDFNGIITGTLDSIIEDILGDNRNPGTPSPEVIDKFVSDALMLDPGLFNQNRYNNNNLRQYIIHLRNGDSFGLNTSGVCKTLKSISDRFHHDRVDIELFRRENGFEGARIACDAISDYYQELENRQLYDFPKLETNFLDQLQNGNLNDSCQNFKHILVDEYQDTNYLQEQIYFELGQKSVENGGSITVVGDDDQSLYRFRGATVDLFSNFPERFRNQKGIDTLLCYLNHNYRSTHNIVTFCNEFITLDHRFQAARVRGKPIINTSRPYPYVNYPVLGIFRDDLDSLTVALSNFIHQITHGRIPIY